MGKYMDPTLEDLRREQAWMREAQAKKEQKPLTAITVALADREKSLKITPQRPQLRVPNLNERQRHEVKLQIPIMMGGLQQAEHQMAPNMTMRGVKFGEKNAAELQAALQALQSRGKVINPQSGATYSSNLTAPNSSTTVKLNQNIGGVMNPSSIVKSNNSTISGLRTETTNQVRDEIAEIKESYENIDADSVRSWTTAEALLWQNAKIVLGTNIVVERYKNDWIFAYRNLIKEAARKYDIPVELLAGVAWSEVGGDPMWIDNIAYPIRKNAHEIVSEKNWVEMEQMFPILKDANKTSFGYLSMQIGVAAEVLGISPDEVDEDTAAEIIEALKDPKFSIFIAAKHLAGLKEIDFPNTSSDELSIDDIATIASRYNIGGAASYDRAAKHSYGRAVKRRISEIMEFIVLD